jgi:ABC-type amino acid transport system permease subunit
MPFVVLPLINRLGGFMLQRITYDPLVQLARSLVQLDIKQVDMLYRAVLGLTIAYGAFEAEVFRAGIESIERGQMEAARSLGMSYFQAMRYIILPQAVRVMLPSLGNDFIAMLKDSSLVSSLAVRDLTQMGKLYRGRTFRSIPAYNTVAALYLVMTLLLSQMVGFLARKMSVEGVERRGEKAAFDTRLAADFLDVLFIGAASLVCLWIAERVGAALGGPLASSQAPFALAFAVIGLIYFLVFWSTSGQTPGKQMMGIRIVPAEGSSMGLGRAILRLGALIVSLPGGALCQPPGFRPRWGYGPLSQRSPSHFGARRPWHPPASGHRGCLGSVQGFGMARRGADCQHHSDSGVHPGILPHRFLGGFHQRLYPLRRPTCAHRRCWSGILVAGLGR